jgi:hypothetical protein
LKTLRFFLTSHILLALVASQVFLQVWLHTVDAPLIGFLITLCICWELGCLAGYADTTTVWFERARRLAAQIDESQQQLDALPEDEHCARSYFSEVLEHLKWAHQHALSLQDIPYQRTKFLSVFPNPARYFARRRELKALTDLRDSFK